MSIFIFQLLFPHRPPQLVVWPVGTISFLRPSKRFARRMRFRLSKKHTQIKKVLSLFHHKNTKKASNGRIAIFSVRHKVSPQEMQVWAGFHIRARTTRFWTGFLTDWHGRPDLGTATRRFWSISMLHWRCTFSNLKQLRHLSQLQLLSRQALKELGKEEMTNCNAEKSEKILYALIFLVLFWQRE